MEFVTIALLAANLIGVALLLVLRRSAGGAGDTAGLEARLGEQLASHRSELRQSINESYQNVDARLDRFAFGVNDSLRVSREELATSLREVTRAIEVELGKLRESNEQKLEQMRSTVDEKLHGTLEQRLGESFKLVSDKLEQVHKGLGEMAALASGVGDLKRVLTNVKSRGGWGEVQLGRQIEDMLTREQYEVNVEVRPGSGERVEFAIRLPGQGEGSPVFLPIDAKFPQEDYERLLLAQEAGVPEEVEAAARALEVVIKAQAKTISEKYIAPPHTTDFAIMYLPTEGLFAEVLRRPGLASQLQSAHRVLVTGPTTLMSILNSLQMGFRTLAIEQSTSEVWRILGAAKREFENYAKVWEKVDQQLGKVQNTVQEVARRTRAIDRSLRRVDSLEQAPGLIDFEDFPASVEPPEPESASSDD